MRMFVNVSIEGGGVGILVMIRNIVLGVIGRGLVEEKVIVENEVEELRG